MFSKMVLVFDSALFFTFPSPIATDFPLRFEIGNYYVRSTTIDDILHFAETVQGKLKRGSINQSRKKILTACHPKSTVYTHTQKRSHFEIALPSPQIIASAREREGGGGEK